MATNSDNFMACRDEVCCTEEAAESSPKRRRASGLVVDASKGIVQKDGVLVVTDRSKHTLNCDSSHTHTLTLSDSRAGVSDR